MNQRELDHALEIDLWELFPHDLENLLAVLLLPILLQIAKEILAQLVSGRPGPPEYPFSQRPCSSRATTLLPFLPFVAM